MAEELFCILNCNRCCCYYPASQTACCRTRGCHQTYFCCLFLPPIPALTQGLGEHGTCSTLCLPAVFFWWNNPCLVFSYFLLCTHTPPYTCFRLGVGSCAIGRIQQVAQRKGALWLWTALDQIPSQVQRLRSRSVWSWAVGKWQVLAW